MSPTGVTLTLTLGSLFAAFELIRVLRAQRHDWDASATFILLMGWLFFLPSTFAGYTGNKVIALGSDQQPIRILLPRAIQVTHLSNYFLLAVPIIILATRATRATRATQHRAINSTALLAAGLCALSALVAGLNRFSLFPTSVSTLLAALLAASVLKPGRGAHLGAAAFVVSLAALSGLLTVLHYDLAVSPCQGQYKCGLLGVYVFGVVDNENGLALALCAGLVFVWLGVRANHSKYRLFGYVLGMIVISGARTSAIAAISLLLLLVAFGPPLRRRLEPEENSASPLGPDQLARIGSAFAVVGASIAGAFLPYVQADQSAYTYRGAVWLVARERLTGAYLLGRSSPGWNALVDQSLIGQYAAYSVHNQILDVLWISGGVGLVLFLIIVGSIIRQDVLIGLVLIFPVAALGITERAWSISHIDGFTFAYLATLLAIPNLSDKEKDENQASSAKGELLPWRIRLSARV